MCARQISGTCAMVPARCVVSCCIVPSRCRATDGQSCAWNAHRSRNVATRRDAMRRIGKRACLPADDRLRSSLPETRLAACGFALPLFASLLFSAREVLVPLYFEAARHRSAGRLCNPSCPSRPRHAEVVAFSPQVHIYRVSPKYEGNKKYLSLFLIWR